ncbi:MAG: serine hydrolase domain-containing protein [Pseudomonadota bacterium]
MTALPVAPPGEVGLCPDRLQRLLDVLQVDIDRGRLPGAVALVARRGKLALFESLGQLNPAAGTPMPRDAIFRIYSMTKPVVSVAVMMLMEQGKLLLSDPVAKHLPEFAGQKVAVERGGQVVLEDVIRPATVQDLLRHTAGLTYEFLGSAAVQRQYAELQMGSRERSNAEFCRTLAALPLMHQPGSVWEYSRATDVLGRLVEVLGGQSLGEYLRERIFIPLGMHETDFAVAEADQHRIAEPFAHDPDGGAPLRVLDPRSRMAMESGGGGLLSTAMDYARFLTFMRNRGELDGVRLLGPHTVDFMTADHLDGLGSTGDLLPPGHGFGLGFAVRTAAGVSPVPGSVGLYYWGGIAGTTFFVDPAQDLYALLMIQAPNQRDHYRPLFRSLVYAALLD